MSKGTDQIFIEGAINLLKQSIDQYNVLPHTTIMKIENIIMELESILEENK
jgi:hypothetical protein